MVAILGVLGYLFMLLRFEAAPLLLGYILGPMVEENMRRALLLSRGDPIIFIDRPISATLLAVTVAMLGWTIFKFVQRSLRRRHIPA